MSKDPINDLHAAYESLTGLKLGLTMGRIYAWEVWLTRGWTAADLQMVVRALVGKAKAQNRQPCLKFSRIVEDLDRFEEELAEARARHRTMRTTPDKARVLRASGRAAEAPLPQPLRIGNVLKGAEALAALRSLRDSL